MKRSHSDAAGAAPAVDLPSTPEAFQNDTSTSYQKPPDAISIKSEQQSTGISSSPVSMQLGSSGAVDRSPKRVKIEPV